MIAFNLLHITYMIRGVLIKRIYGNFMIYAETSDKRAGREGLCLSFMFTYYYKICFSFTS
jgi:hypothetical protein